MSDSPDEMAKRTLCSPLHRCFPPRPTVCFVCGGETNENCLFKARDDEAVGNYRNLRGDSVHDGDVVT